MCILERDFKSDSCIEMQPVVACVVSSHLNAVIKSITVQLRVSTALQTPNTVQPIS